MTVHTYPEYHPETCLATFRVDIDVATCGEITPLSTLDYLIGSFDSGHHHDGLPGARVHAGCGRKKVVYGSLRIRSIRGLYLQGNAAALRCGRYQCVRGKSVPYQDDAERGSTCRIICLRQMSMNFRRPPGSVLWTACGGR